MKQKNVNIKPKLVVCPKNRKKASNENKQGIIS